jgi:ketosteroid isomerase-like protein
MKKTTITLFALAAGILLTSMNLNKAGKTDLDDARKAIAASNAIYFRSFAKNDPAIFIDRYDDDAVILAPNGPAFSGKAEALKFFLKAYDKIGLRDGRFITTAVYGEGIEYVAEEGLWQSFDAKGKMFDDGKFLVLWKKTQKGWKMFRDSFSSNHPAKN